MPKCIDCGYCGVKAIGTQIIESCYNSNVFAPIPLDVEEEKDCNGFVQRTGVSAWDRLTEKEREYFYEVAKKRDYAQSFVDEMIEIMKTVEVIGENGFAVI